MEMAGFFFSLRTGAGPGHNVRASTGAEVRGSGRDSDRTVWKIGAEHLIGSFDGGRLS